MTQKKKDILCLVLPIICAVVALSSAIGVGISVARMGDIKEIVETRLSEPAQQATPVETEQAIPTPTYAPSPEPAMENSAPTKSAAEQPKQKAAVEPAVKQEPSKPTEQPKPEVKQEITVYVTKYGECYHSDRNCYYIRKSEATALFLSEAKKLYRPCSHCAG